jgi:hypothetical protein
MTRPAPHPATGDCGFDGEESVRPSAQRLDVFVEIEAFVEMGSLERVIAEREMIAPHRRIRGRRVMWNERAGACGARLQQTAGARRRDTTELQHANPAKGGKLSSRRGFADDVVVFVACSGHRAHNQRAAASNKGLDPSVPFGSPYHPVRHVKQLESGQVVWWQSARMSSNAMSAASMPDMDMGEPNEARSVDRVPATAE